MTDQADPAPGGDRTFGLALAGAVQALLVALVGAIASLSFVAFIGGAVLWARFYALGLPPDEVVAAVPRRELLATGASVLTGFGLLGLLAVGGAYIFDCQGRGSKDTQTVLLVLTGAALAIVAALAETSTWELIGGIAVAIAAPAASFVVLSRFHAPGSERLSGQGVAVQIAVVGVGAALFYAVFRELWVVAAFAVALALYLGVLSVAQASGSRFVPYALALFVAVVFFGGAVSALHASQSAQVQPAVALRADEADPVCGIFVGESSDRLYFGRIDRDRKQSGSVQDGNTGHIFWLDKRAVTGWAIGALQAQPEAVQAMGRLRTRVLDERRPRVQTQTIATIGKDGATTTAVKRTTTSVPDRSGSQESCTIYAI